MKTLIVTTTALALMAASPAYAGKHHDGDVILGAAIGLGVGLLAASQPSTTTVVQETAVVYQPAPVAYYQPAPTVYYQQQPVVYYQPAPPPVYYAPAPAYYRSYRAYDRPRYVHRHGYRYAYVGGYYHGGY